jgi:threonine/homoserine/homoserine lactone efflux protein
MPEVSLFLIAAALLTIAPGPDNVYVLTRGITQGRLAGLAAAVGFAAGCLFHTALAAFGIAALIKSSPLTLTLVKLAGAAYLIYIGARILIAAFRPSRKAQIAVNQTEPLLSLTAIFKQSVIGNMLNPKVTLFFLSFLPQFLNPKAGNEAIQMAVLGALFMLQTVVIFGVIALASGFIGDKLRTNPRIALWLDRLAGITFIALGIRVALPESSTT